MARCWQLCKPRAEVATLRILREKFMEKLLRSMWLFQNPQPYATFTCKFWQVVAAVDWYTSLALIGDNTGDNITSWVILEVILKNNTAPGNPKVCNSHQHFRVCQDVSDFTWQVQRISKPVGRIPLLKTPSNSVVPPCCGYCTCTEESTKTSVSLTGTAVVGMLKLRKLKMQKGYHGLLPLFILKLLKSSIMSVNHVERLTWFV